MDAWMRNVLPARDKRLAFHPPPLNFLDPIQDEIEILIASSTVFDGEFEILTKVWS